MATKYGSDEATKSWLVQVAAHIRDEYDLMPGLCLTPSQAQRLWALDAHTCRLALTSMVEIGFLTVSAFGYVRADLEQLDQPDARESKEGWENGLPCQRQTPQPF